MSKISEWTVHLGGKKQLPVYAVSHAAALAMAKARHNTENVTVSLDGDMSELFDSLFRSTRKP